LEGTNEMSVEYPFFSFAAPPRTGCDHFIEACRIAGLGKTDRIDAIRHFPRNNDGKHLRVSLVRHPCQWLGSVYAALNDFGTESSPNMHGIGTAFIVLDKSTFDDFVRSYLQMSPTGVSCLFDQYKADTRLRSEDMPWCLLELFETFEVPKVLLGLVETYWRSKVFDVVPEWTPHLYQQVLDAEWEFCEAYDYY